jgi:hypothetical protein
VRLGLLYAETPALASFGSFGINALPVKVGLEAAAAGILEP